MEYVSLTGYIAALLLVIALAGVSLLLKRYTNNPGALRSDLKGKLGRFASNIPERRLAIVETLMLGPKQRVFIIRRDNVEHLVLSTPDGTSVIEAGIPAIAAAKEASAS